MKNNYLHTGNTTEEIIGASEAVFRAFGVVVAVIVGVALAAGPEHLGAQNSKSQETVAENPDASTASVQSQASSGKNPIAEKYKTLVMRVYFRGRAERDQLAQELQPEEVPTTGGYLTVIRDRDLYYGDARLSCGDRREQQSQPQRPSTHARNSLQRLQVGGRNIRLPRPEGAQFPNLVEKVDIGDSWCKSNPGSCVATQSLERLRPVGATHHEPQHTRPQTGLLGRRRYTRPRNRYARSRHAHDRLPAQQLRYRCRRSLAGGLSRHLAYARSQPRRPPHRRGGRRRQQPVHVPQERQQHRRRCFPGLPQQHHFGADNNRNFPFQWGCCNGSSDFVCDQTYRGASAGSEPEDMAIVNKLRTLVPDQRGPGDTDPAPITATGVYQNIHTVVPVPLFVGLECHAHAELR